LIFDKRRQEGKDETRYPAFRPNTRSRTYRDSYLSIRSNKPK
jgi:hypothetical protein